MLAIGNVQLNGGRSDKWRVGGVESSDEWRVMMSREYDEWRVVISGE